MSDSDLRATYTTLLAKRQQTEPSYGGRKLPCVLSALMFDAMIEDARGGGRFDWLRYNPVLRAACRQHGIRTSAVLRAYLTTLETLAPI